MIKPNASFRRGFSLLEMTVVLGIVAIMTAIVLWNLPEMKGGLSVDIVSQEVAIYVRGAQVYSRATKSSAGGSSFNSFGVHFTPGSGNFFLWADRDDSASELEPDYHYDPTLPPDGDGAPEENYKLPAGFRIDGLWYEIVDSGTRSFNPITGSADVFFRRPDPEAKFACAPELDCALATNLWVRVMAANGAQYRFVRVSPNGQITVLGKNAGPQAASQ
jgi:prepilin-type N-terminal cleavage/methylation domain-containing protein